MSYLRGTGRFGDRNKFPYPDLLLLDYQMPRLNGLEVMALLREEEIRLQVILWSNALELVDVELAKHLGASVVCQKPMNGRETAAIVNQLDCYAPEPATLPLSFVLSSAHALRA
jgi:CheY-like chemotaxis protein